jgi:hypothetical protein
MTSIRLSFRKDENNVKITVEKLRIERAEGAVETLEIFIVNGNAIISYAAGV